LQARRCGSAVCGRAPDQYRGLGEAVTRAVTNAGFDLGARINTLQASPMGAPIYLRMGYQTVFDYRVYVRFVQ